MPDKYDNADALLYTTVSPGDERRQMTHVGTIHGVVIEYVAARNGEGRGRLRLDSDGANMRYRAPGSATFGAAVDVSAGGTFVIEDGDDTDNYVRAVVHPTHLAPASDERDVQMIATYERDRDVSAPDAAAGVVNVIEMPLANFNATHDATNIVCWFEPGTQYVELGASDIGPWSTPFDEGSAVAIGDALVGQTRPAFVRRSIPAASVADPRVPLTINYRFTLDGVQHYGQIRVLYRIFNDAELRFYRALGTPPLETDAPFATSPDPLPYTPPDIFGDGEWFVSVSLFNGVLDSGFLPLGPNGETYQRIIVQGGNEVALPPTAPFDVKLIAREGGVVEVQAYYFEANEPPPAAPRRADEWVIAYTTNGIDPGEMPGTAPDVVVPIPYGAGTAILQTLLPAQSDGTDVRVRVQVRRTSDDQYSEGSTVVQINANASPPTDPLDLQRYTGIAE